MNLLGYGHDTVPTKRLIYDRDPVPTKRVIYDRDTVPTKRLIYDLDTVPTKRVIYDLDIVPNKRVIYGHNCNVYWRLHQHKRRHRVVHDRCKHQPRNLATLHVEKWARSFLSTIARSLRMC